MAAPAHGQRSRLVAYIVSAIARRFLLRALAPAESADLSRSKPVPLPISVGREAPTGKRCVSADAKSPGIMPLRRSRFTAGRKKKKPLSGSQPHWHARSTDDAEEDGDAVVDPVVVRDGGVGDDLRQRDGRRPQYGRHRLCPARQDRMEADLARF